MITLSKVTVVEAPAPPTTRVWSSVNSAQPLISVILFFFIRKCTPLTIRSDDRAAALRRPRRSRSVTSPEMPKILASWVKMWAISALRSSALVGMQPTLRQTPPQYFSSMIAVDNPS